MKSLLLFCLVFGWALAQANHDRINSLPGLSDEINFQQYAGYIDVDAANGRKLFYWFVESQLNPQEDPLVLWLNGGPGCSSLGGLMTELGPFRPNPDGSTVSLNPWSWNKIANVIFLESPAGVGFSTSNVESDYTTGDVKTANDSFTFLQGFMKRFPQFKNHKFWVTGESYGGHYVVELAARIVRGNKEGNPKINIQGFMVGNAWTDMPIDNAGAVFTWWSHSLISDLTYSTVMKTCNFTHIGPLSVDDDEFKRMVSDDANCNKWLNIASNEMGNIDIYDMFTNVCLKTQEIVMVNHLAKAGSRPHIAMAGKILPYRPCEDEYTSNYLNRADVQRAIHASIPYAWHDCSPRVNYNYADVEKSVLPVYEELFKENLRILVYSGDVDAIVPTPGTKHWISKLKRPILKPWRPYTVSKQVGGYVTVYRGLTFATVRGAGHMVPGTQPERAYEMFRMFLHGEME